MEAVEYGKPEVPAANEEQLSLRWQEGLGIPRLTASEQLLHSARKMKATYPSELFKLDSERAGRYCYECGELSIDLSGQRWDQKVLGELLELARESGWRNQLKKMVAGEAINRSENRPVLHMALRAGHGNSAHFPGWVAGGVEHSMQQMRSFTTELHSGARTGADGSPFTDLILVGIGGSLLGPRLAYKALRAWWQPGLRLHFLENIDPCAYTDLIEALDPKTTLVLIASKTFTTLETLKNAEALRCWMQSAGISKRAVNQQFIALTAATERAVAWGIAEDSIFPMWDWVGGRFSLWSTIGLPLMLALQPGAFDGLLTGAARMDEHLQQAEDSKNLPLLMALADCWNHNFLGIKARAVVPYSHRLACLGSYLKQLEMESNGKNTDDEGELLPHHTSPLVLDGVGTSAQHSFFQLLHQGCHGVAVEILTVASAEQQVADHHQWLNANAQGQIQALIYGSPATAQDQSQYVEGGQPVSHLQLKQLNPESLGQLLALYEHKVFILAQLWGNNAFDQPGVELGKQLAKKIHAAGPQASSQALPVAETSKEHHVAILMASYNGERFLAEQLDSIQRQSHQQWTLHVSDDGSQDRTLEQLAGVQSDWGEERLKVVAGPERGFVANFLSLVCREEIQGDFFAWSDQDDIWCEDKLEAAVAWLKSIPAETPALYCGRTKLICQSGFEIGHSPLFTCRPHFSNALVQSLAGGNTMVFNQAARALLQEAGNDLNVPSHDWWAYQLISGAGGVIHYARKPTILYRQHGENLIGANTKWSARLLRIRGLMKGQFREWNEQTITSLELMRHRLTEEHQVVLEHFKAARQQFLPRRIISCLRAGIYRQTLFGNLGLILATLLKKL